MRRPRGASPPARRCRRPWPSRPPATSRRPIAWPRRTSSTSPRQEQKKELEALRKTAGAPPATLVGKSDAEALAYLQKQKDRRQEIQTRIATLQTQREAYLSRTAPARDGFDEQVLAALRSRAKAVGIEY